MIHKLKKLLIKNLITAVQTEIAPALIQRVMDQFQVGLIGKVDQKDPSAPEHFKGDFLEILTEHASSSFVSTQDGICFSLCGTSKLGYDGSISAPVQTMVFLLEGILGEYAFISPDIYKMYKKKSGNLGRWSGGFLITKDSFFEGSWDKVVSWGTARWGFSNTGPINIFEIDDSIVSETINKTIKKTIKEFASQLRAEHGKK